jgi:5-methylcytosine-specific restriction endonuclease McrA
MKWVESNLERRTSYNKKYNKDNAEKLYENKKAKYASNPELQAKYNKKWKENNPENVAATEHRRRARKASNGVNLVTAAEIAAIIAQPCMACDAPAPSTIEHLIPISRGGAHSVGNLAPLCKPCNSSKNDMTLAEWKHSNRAQAKKAFGR